ncbi:hypothetical protein D1012_12510 [Pseudotabrizicola alkalilacus]|uniref:Uncharacterized protein n=2 Tax=Pseudotabrizicola alkalilacus TaxID=2305252 RepID=A0A411Z1M6_9RHOB|nr:hypothetical protein D1012_12510 [Pseudotabrizicola alkalilacus]
MSEPMSNHEIEDVLSSIRRLVSEDLRPAPAAAPEPVAEKLLLTPALRVVTAPDVITPAPEPEPEQAVAPSEPVAPVEDVVARLGAAVTEEEWESPFGDPEVWPGALASDAPPRDEAAVPGSPVTAASPDFLEAPRAGFAEAEDLLPDAVEADAVEATPQRLTLREVSPPEDDSAWQDAGWADEAEAAVRADLAQETEEEVISGLYDAQAGGMVFDEEVLRDLVRDLIREELSGTLGERITRNVRKLVRAEIARAMALREFE